MPSLISHPYMMLFSAKLNTPIQLQPPIMPSLISHPYMMLFSAKLNIPRLIQDFCGLWPLYDYLSAVFVSAVTHPHPRHLVSEDHVMNRPESPAVANALASLCLRLVAIILALMLGLALALGIIFTLALWYPFVAR
jgi:hypothetical protein